MTNYTTFLIQNEEVGIKFGLPAVKMASSSSIDEKSNETLDFSAYVIYAGYVNNCIRKEEKPKFTYEDFLDQCEEYYTNGEQNRIADAILVFNECSILQNLAKKGREKQEQVEDEKKSQTGTSLTLSPSESSDSPSSNTTSAPGGSSSLPNGDIT